MESAQYATGKRKCAIARAWIEPGTGEILVNALPLDRAFPRLSNTFHVRSPLEATETLEQYNVRATVSGGGNTGQSIALRHAIAKALALLNPTLRDVLKKRGMLTRDARTKERKKYGQKGARGRFQYSKR